MKAARKPRLYRLLTPAIVVLALIVGTVTVRWLSEPDYSDKHYLSPSTRGVTSGDKLAELLQDKGITIDRHTGSSSALRAVSQLDGRATLFAPAPEFMHTDYLELLRDVPPGTRVVLVEPSGVALGYAVPPLGIADRRWATAVTTPGPACALSDAPRVGVTRSRYGLYAGSTFTARFCYEHGLAAVTFSGVEFVVTGSPEPFRADRIGEHDNAEFAVDLLSARPNLVWLDIHSEEAGLPQPSRQPRPTFSRRPPAPSGSQEQPSPFPPWLFPLAAMLLLTAVALAFARGRRLGGPVSEPLPIEVRGAETAIGRGNLYRRAKARGAALETLRFEARQRLAVLAGLPPNTAKEPLLDALQTWLHDDRALLGDILYGPEPESDEELETRTRELLLLVEQATRGKKEKPQ